MSAVTTSPFAGCQSGWSRPANGCPGASGVPRVEDEGLAEFEDAGAEEDADARRRDRRCGRRCGEDGAEPRFRASGSVFSG